MQTQNDFLIMTLVGTKGTKGVKACVIEWLVSLSSCSVFSLLCSALCTQKNDEGDVRDGLVYSKLPSKLHQSR